MSSKTFPHKQPTRTACFERVGLTQQPSSDQLREARHVYKRTRTTEHAPDRFSGKETMRRMKLSAAALAVAGLAFSTAAAGDDAVTGMSRERLERLDDHFHAYVDAGEIAGVVTYVSRHGQIVHQDAYGLADI